MTCGGIFIDANGATIAAFATLAIAWFTLTLKLSTDKLWGAGERQLKKMSETTELASKQFALEGRQADIASRQKEIARQQFIAEHRPRLRIRNFVITPPERHPIFHGSTISGHCYVENIGGMAAVITESHLEIFANQMGLPMESPYEGKTGNDVISGTLNVGESRRFPFNQKTPFATDGEADRARGGDHPVFILGWVHYRDQSEQGVVHGVVRRLSFCRQWNAQRRRFVRIEDDPDYEHDG